MSENERMAIRALRAGIVPPSHVTHFSVGLTDLEPMLEARLEHLARGEAVRSLVIMGDWGTGKTHCLWYAQHRANLAGVPASILSLDARSSPLNYPQFWYEAIVTRMRTSSGIGLLDLVREHAKRGPEFVPMDPFEQVFRNALIRAQSGGLSEDTREWLCLRGGDLSWSGYGYLKQRAIDRLAALARSFHKLGLGGLLLGLDELETIEQLGSIRSRATAYAVLGRLHAMQHLVLMLGVTPRFDRLVREDYARGLADASYTSPEAHMFLTEWVTNSFDTWTPPEPTRKHGISLAERVATTYQRAYSCNVQHARVTAAVEEWYRSPARNYRKLMRRLVYECDILRPISGSQ
jgi:hypothetical protein